LETPVAHVGVSMAAAEPMVSVFEA
jgi:hypothetical protein